MIDLLCLLKLPPEGRNKLKPELRLLLNCSQGLSQNRCQTPGDAHLALSQEMCSLCEGHVAREVECAAELNEAKWLALR